MFERFSEFGIQAVMFAREEARLLSQKRVGPELLLLGILQVKRRDAARILREHGADLEGLRIRLQSANSPAENPVELAQIFFVERAKKAMEIAARESTAFLSDSVRTQLHCIERAATNGYPDGAQDL